MTADASSASAANAGAKANAGASAADASPTPPQVALFATCLVDMFRPGVGFAAARLLAEAGCEVTAPAGQTCCGQPAFNSGDRRDAAAVAQVTIAALEACDYVVVPSGSCAGMIAKHYPELFADDPVWGPRAAAVAAKTWELLSFLTEVMKCDAGSIQARLPLRATYHDSCSGLRELGVKAQPRALLAGVEGLDLVEMAAPEVCCGFGGAFCVKYPDISNAMVEKKAADIRATGARLLLAGDLGCLMNMAGKLDRLNAGIEARHVAEVLADMADAPAIGRQ